MFHIDPNHPTPLYAQLERSIRFAIATGKLGIGEQLPTVRQLAVDLRVNANTVARVYAELERVGVLETRRGVGSFVAAGRAAAQPLHEKARRLRELVTRILAEADRAGFDIDDLIGELGEQRHQHADRSRSAKERSS